MRIVLTVENESFLLPKEANIDEVIKLAEGAIKIKKGYGSKDKWRLAHSLAEITIQIVSDIAIDPSVETTPEPTEEA